MHHLRVPSFQSLLLFQSALLIYNYNSFLHSKKMFSMIFPSSRIHKCIFLTLQAFIQSLTLLSASFLTSAMELDENIVIHLPPSAAITSSNLSVMPITFLFRKIHRSANQPVCRFILSSLSIPNSN